MCVHACVHMCVHACCMCVYMRERERERERKEREERGKEVYRESMDGHIGRMITRETDLHIQGSIKVSCQAVLGCCR